MIFHFVQDRSRLNSLTTDDNGIIIAESRYYSFGEERWSSGAGVTDFTFNAQRAESRFGLQDFNARYFSPKIGRFLTPDSIVPDYSNPQDLNRYSYVRNNPIKFTDPTGHATECGVTPDDCGTAVDGELVTAVHRSNEWRNATSELVNLYFNDTRQFWKEVSPEAWHDEIDAQFDWSDQWMPLIEWGLSIAMMTAGSPSSTSGLARLKYYKLESGPHMSIMVKYGDDVLETHQTNYNKALTFIQEPSGLPKPTATKTFYLPNAKAAQALQLELMDAGNLGTYKIITNSCASHACDILSAGGAKGVPTRGIDRLRWLEALMPD